MEPISAKEGLGLVAQALNWLRNLWPRRTRPKLILATLPRMCHFQVTNSSQSRTLLADVGLMATNLADLDVTIIDVRLHLPTRFRLASLLGIMKRDGLPTVSNLPASARIPVSSDKIIICHFIEESTEVEEYLPFNATLRLKDQLGNSYRVKKVPFASWSKPSKVKPLETEPLFSLSSETEKVIVSFLKEEIDAYKRNGRGVGGLGSLGKIGEINVSQGNVARLCSYIGNLEPEDKAIAKSALVARLSSDGEYATVAYAIILTLWKMYGGVEMSSRLSTLKNSGDARSLSNSYATLEALLISEGTSWTPADLDLVESLAHKNPCDFTERITTAISRVRIQRPAA